MPGKPNSWIDRLQKDAQANELDYTNTNPLTFVFLGFIQLPVLLLLSYYVSPNTVTKHVVGGFEVYMNRWSYMAFFNIAIHWGGFLFAVLINSVKYFDITEDIGYMATLVWSYQQIGGEVSTRQKLVYGCAILWNIRLLAFLGYRILVRGSDWRFDKLNKATAYQFFGWTSGGTWCWANGFALWFVAECPQSQGLGPVDFLGFALFAIGLTLELVADIQKYRFNANHPAGTNKKWITTGLWAHSRHPNYFFENLLWFGLSLVSMSGRFTDPSHLGGIATCLVTPAWSFFFLVFTSMMLLEKRCDAKWGDDARYQAYKAATPVWMPKLCVDEAAPLRGQSTGRAD